MTKKEWLGKIDDLTHFIEKIELPLIKEKLRENSKKCVELRKKFHEDQYGFVYGTAVCSTTEELLKEKAETLTMILYILKGKEK